jgi:hypothetical protein
MITKIQQDYETDFYAWAMHNSKLLRERRFSEIDIENIAEEIESMGTSEKSELINRLTVLMSHLLKWEFQRERRGHSWLYTIKEQRLRIKRRLKKNPSLKSSLNESLNEAYEYALLQAVSDTGLSERTFPEECPYSLEEVFDNDFYPG